MEARSFHALHQRSFPIKKHMQIIFDLTAFSWKSPEPLLALAVPLSPSLQVATTVDTKPEAIKLTGTLKLHFVGIVNAAFYA
jgi:hypothetical protein